MPKLFDFQDDIDYLKGFATTLLKTSHMTINGMPVVQLQEEGAHEAADLFLKMVERLARLEEKLNRDYEIHTDHSKPCPMCGSYDLAESEKSDES